MKKTKKKAAVEIGFDIEMEEVVKSKSKGAVLPATYCVTGASGYIGSWLIMSLLQKGYFVHATVRHPGILSFFL